MRMILSSWIVSLLFHFSLNILKMKAMSNTKPKAFSSRRISIDQALRVLRRNGIQANEDQARIILDFLYLIAKTISKPETLNR